MMRPLLVHLLLQAVLRFDTLAWEVKMPKDIHGLKGSCLVIPCSFSYSSYPPKNPRRIVWYQWVSRGYPLVYDPLHPSDVIEKFRSKTNLYVNPSYRDCSLLIKNLELSHNREKLYAWIDPENVGWSTYAFYHVTSTIIVDDHPQQPSINIYGGERMGDTITVTCSTSHTCPYSKPKITLKGIEGSDQLNNENIKDGMWKITLTRTSIVKAERSTIECSVTHYGGLKVSTTKDKTAKCVHRKITIEPQLADVTEGVAKNFICSVHHSCQKETPTITWNYKNMKVSIGNKRLSSSDLITYSDITFLASKDDHGKKLICIAKFSGGNTETSVVLHVQRVMNYDALGWEVKMPKDIHGLQGSCLVIPCSFSYTSNPPKNPHRVVWYQWVSEGHPLVYDSMSPGKVIAKFRGKTDLYRNSNCSLLIKNLERTHHGEILYTRIDPENVAWDTYKVYDVTFTILVDASPQKPSITIYGGERMCDTITIVCSTFHTCPYSKPKITLKGIEGTDDIKDEDIKDIKDGLWKITLTRKGVVKAESSTIECSVTHYGDIRVTATEVKSAKCVHHKITIEPELADVTEGVAKNFICSVHHSCQKETPTITWNYENMRVLTGREGLSSLDQIIYSNITFLASKDDHGKKLICTAKFSGGNTETSVVLRVQHNQKRVQILDETHFQNRADVLPKIKALTRSCVVIPCKFKMEEEHFTHLQFLWVTNNDGYMFHTKTDSILGNFKGRTRLLGNPDEQNCTVEMDDVQPHDNGPFCFRAEKENEKYSFSNSCVFIIMQASPDKPVMSSLAEDNTSTLITAQCSVNHTCSSHPPKITWSVPTAQETISHNHIGGGVWETVSAVTFIPTGYEEKDEIVCSAEFWGGKTQNNTAIMNPKRVQGVGFVPYIIASSLVFILICILAGVFTYKRRHRDPRHDMQTQSEQNDRKQAFLQTSYSITKE